jgi:hypothetical protein
MTTLIWGTAIAPDIRIRSRLCPEYLERLIGKT